MLSSLKEPNESGCERMPDTGIHMIVIEIYFQHQ